MAFNYRCGLADTVEIISEEVLLIDHHSVIHTLRVGRVFFNSDNIGIFLYTTVQMVFTAWFFHMRCISRKAIVWVDESE